MHKRFLEIGCQNNRFSDEWLTLDILPGENVDIVCDIVNKPIPLDKDLLDLVYMSHVIEHVPWFDTVRVLTEICRIIKPGGKLEIYTPDLKKLVVAYLNKKLPDNWRRYNGESNPMKWFLGRLYAYGDSANDPNWHKAIFDKEYLIYCLKEAGFTSFKDINKPRGHNHGHINLGIEAIK